MAIFLGLEPFFHTQRPPILYNLIIGTLEDYFSTTEYPYGLISAITIDIFMTQPVLGNMVNTHCFIMDYSSVMALISPYGYSVVVK